MLHQESTKPLRFSKECKPEKTTLSYPNPTEDDNPYVVNEERSDPGKHCQQTLEPLSRLTRQRSNLPPVPERAELYPFFAFKKCKKHYKIVHIYVDVIFIITNYRVHYINFCKRLSVPIV